MCLSRYMLPEIMKPGWQALVIEGMWAMTKQKLSSFLPWNPSTISLPDSITLGSQNITFTNSARNLGFILHSKLHIIKICHTAYFELKSSVCRFLTEDAAKTLVTSHISHSLTTAIVSLWVHLILSSILSKKCKTLLQDSFSWHPITTSIHHTWKNFTGFPFQNILSIKSLYMFQCCKRFVSIKSLVCVLVL